MAIISVLLSGVAGFTSFLAAWLIFDSTFVVSVAIYLATAVGLSTLFVGVMVMRTRPVHAAAIAAWDQDALAEREEIEARLESANIETPTNTAA